MTDLKNDALGKTKKAIRDLQEQISDRLFKITEKVDQLSQHLSPKEVIHFLHAGCEMDLADARAYVKIAGTLKDSNEVLRDARVQFPVLKALAASAPETRQEVLARIAEGATVGIRDVAAVRTSLRRKTETYAEQITRDGFNSSLRSARRRAAEAVREIDSRVAALLSLLNSYRPDTTTEHSQLETHAAIQSAATSLLPVFVATYGKHEIPLERVLAMPSHASERNLALAYAAIEALAAGRFGGEYRFALDNASLETQWVTHFQECLQPVTSTIAPINFDTVVQEKPPLIKLPTQKLTVVELCAGAGGMSLGLEEAGFVPLALYEFDRHAAATLRLNRPFWNVVEGDVRQVDFKKHASMSVDLLVGGLPCQPYSIDGKGLGKDDPRDLLLEGARAVREIRPSAFIFENVTGLLNARHADHLGNFLRQLKKCGYLVHMVRMEAEDLGIAQERTRILFVGMRQKHMASFRAPPAFPEWRTNMGDVLEDLMAANGWAGAKEWADARRSFVVVRNGVEKRGALASTVVGRKGGSREKEAARWAKKGVDIATVADAAPTQAQADKAGPGFLPRLTLRMRARLQGFPDWWDFAGGKDSKARQVGNAVPPVIGKAIGLAVRSALTGNNFDYSFTLRMKTENRERLHSEPPLLQDNRATPILTGIVADEAKLLRDPA
ncbi:DNA (cytosine-5)-methyltransferase 1 [Rhizobium sp. BK650]|uniref:DNA cytosine methyltransferase n=1 Tax=Rhizobium sp. BK650 TaxID=2586990 RepID=UPI00160B5733|nr:DNA (cytosine-5-)-methyltransferase [Rhizobium sp. BK650]MBB3658414.1 DNA (cytosine-5)-methyltransferase 1 [Rhizobium sp. BK650]